VEKGSIQGTDELDRHTTRHALKLASLARVRRHLEDVSSPRGFSILRMVESHDWSREGFGEVRTIKSEPMTIRTPVCCGVVVNVGDVLAFEHDWKVYRGEPRFLSFQADGNQKSGTARLRKPV
jgi:hypothetical protein